MRYKYLDFETIKAASDIISAIVDSSLQEREGVVPVKSDKFSFFKKSPDYISLSFKNTEVYLKIKMNIQKGMNIIEETTKIQKEIKDEIIHLTGLKVRRVDLFIDKIIHHSSLEDFR
ncbi:Asp23/Gls24 family envelope stress response protein [Bacillus sp. ISL-47]|uniref:Asp23/Gls24 family envelope stress response protein n=1 Tax=Bacillus sp. ISL-47 TaxID=2819130 RepID=UPI001BE56F6E|nr:Asp23/Gls24 family envelope stress response protein [Bacillus sp. ISL-47]MBT2687897.1 Asp23/Gls24 family envelope stress response protein [Bacillus sp. ISL-47]MBT2708026.1 Asp23/Gls24 family envelope stress response protein [Pseudomonas sp. ISL-84]